MTTYYAAGEMYCSRRRCRVLHRQGDRVTRTEDVDGLDPCDRHADASDDAEGGVTVDEVEAIADEVIAERIEDGRCPWCEGEDGYEGDHVGAHASSAHPEEWSEYRENSE